MTGINPDAERIGEFCRTVESGVGRELIECNLCPRSCRIPPGQKGFCRVREHRNGGLRSLNYGKVSSAAVDPVEKKPLYHFHPGRNILSVGTVGCNFSCQFCQNWQIAQKKAPTRSLMPDELGRLALDASEAHGSVGVAYTYSEPTVWYEKDSSQIVRELGLANVLVTNGFMSKEPMDALIPFIDAMNIDVKGFGEKYYGDICGGSLRPVMDTVERVAGRCHVEITTLVIPGLNDTPEEMKGLSKWLGSLSPDIPFHLSRYFPQYLMKQPPTPVETLVRLRDIAREELRYVYIGNAEVSGASDTLCHNCGNIVVRRKGYGTDASGLAHGENADDVVCVSCRMPLAFIL